MATVNLCNIQLVDKWPGTVNTNLGIPTGGWDNTTDNFKTTASTDSPGHDVGTKIMGYTDNSYAPGNYTMMYLMYHGFSSSATIDADDFSTNVAVCVHYDASEAQKYGVDSSVVPYYVVCNCYTTSGSDLSAGMPCAIPCASLDTDGTVVVTNSYEYGDSYGWFWVGGVCPADDATILQGTGSAANGCEVTVGTGTASALGRAPCKFDWANTGAQLESLDSSVFKDSTIVDMEAIHLMTPDAYIDTSAT